MSERDLFANFDRMRRELDELFGDALGATRLSHRQAGGWPAVDVAVASDPPRAIVIAELAGMSPEEIALQIDGRRLYLAGRREPAATPGEVYQQIEIVRGAFRRMIEFTAEIDAEGVTARYEDGMLRVEVPLLHRPSGRRAVRIETGEA